MVVVELHPFLFLSVDGGALSASHLGGCGPRERALWPLVTSEFECGWATKYFRLQWGRKKGLVPYGDLTMLLGDSVCILVNIQTEYVEIKHQLDATDDFYCRSYCLLNMFRAPLYPSSGAREYYTSGCCLSYLMLGFQVVGMVWC